MNETLSLQDILKIIKKNAVLMVVITAIITGAMIVYIKSFTVPAYSASTKVFVGKDGEDATYYDTSDIALYRNLLSTYSEVAQTKELVKEAVKKTKYDSLDENKILAGLTVKTIEDTQIIQLSYVSTDAEEAAEILELITTEFIKEAKELVANSKLNIIEPVEVPKNPISTNSSMKMVVGFCLGIMISLIVIFFKEYLTDTYDDEEVLEKDINLPVLAVVPYAKVKGGK